MILAHSPSNPKALTYVGSKILSKKGSLVHTDTAVVDLEHVALVRGVPLTQYFLDVEAILPKGVEVRLIKESETLEYRLNLWGINLVCTTKEQLVDVLQAYSTLLRAVKTK
jgi:hypothetical protein